MTTSDYSSHNDSDSDIRVMLVDDSAVIRGALTRIVDSIPNAKVVSSLANGADAIKRTDSIAPDIIILDIEMPIMDGLTALPKILEVRPETKVIMFSSLTEKGASVTMEAMRLGAVECLVKPSSSQDVGPGSDFQKKIIDLIQNLVPSKKVSAPSSTGVPGSTTADIQAEPSTTAKSYTLRSDIGVYHGKPSILAIGSSTGGPQALFEVLKSCKGFDIPIIITQHMPPTFTKILAQHIEQNTGIESFEGEDGMAILPGKVYVAPGGYHMTFVKDGARLVIKLDDGPQVNFCKPAVDPMFESIITHYGQKVLGVILTGMGHDGLNGGKTLVEKRGRLIAQDEATSIVWGMPGAVTEAGLCSEVLPLADIGPWIKQAVMG